MEAQKPNTPQKPVAAKSKKTQGEHKVRGIKNAFLVILCCAVIAVCLYIFVFGDASHFDPQTGHPLAVDGDCIVCGTLDCTSQCKRNGQHY